MQITVTYACYSASILVCFRSKTLNLCLTKLFNYVYCKKHSYSQNKHKRWKQKHSSYHYLCHNKRDIQAKLPIQPQYQRLRKELHFLDELKTFSYSREANESARSMQIKAKADKNKSSTRRSELYQNTWIFKLCYMGADKINKCPRAHVSSMGVGGGFQSNALFTPI